MAKDFSRRNFLKMFGIGGALATILPERISKAQKLFSSNSASIKVSSIPSNANFLFLKGITEAVVEASRVREGQKIGNYGPNITGGTVIKPGGRNSYPAFWVRDFAMSLESGFITLEEQRHALVLTASKQQQGDWVTGSGSLVPDGSIVDHVSLDNKAIFFPGTIGNYEQQGGKWGKLPSLDDHFYFAHMAWKYLKNSGGSDILNQQIEGKKLIDRLDLAFSVVSSRPATGLVFADEDNRGVGFGFTDSIIHTGELLFCSLLKYQAANQLAEMHRILNNTEKANSYESIAAVIKSNIGQVFKGSTGLLRASTGISNQPDVWGSAFAVYIGAVESDDQTAICNALANAYKNGTVSYRGNIRHVLTTDDYSQSTMWQKTVNTPVKNTYQNGAYWGTATGWVCYAINRINPVLARKLANEYIDELRENDFRKGATFGSPWECFHPQNDYKQNGVYMTSVTCPLEAMRKMGWIS